MKSFRTSLSEFNRMHPLLAAPTVGVLSVGFYTLGFGAMPRFDAWSLFVAAGAGGAIGRLLQERRRESHEQS